ncbi:ATP-dependent nuclease subunit B [Lacticaseibacillus rhamnosus]|uniref:ATP-dependent nuclease subunit B n=1 Tax=Lacticaseibacillus rhamnosus TaxID=47715 RepID=A0AAX0K1A3_LACRH|nr:ATP-dependent nuclease subunit B [Lacticaseibacillus rhamnosus]
MGPLIVRIDNQRFRRRIYSAQKVACKDLGRNGQSPAITPKAAYTPIAKRSCSRSAHYNAFASAEVCV